MGCLTALVQDLERTLDRAGYFDAGAVEQDSEKVVPDYQMEAAQQASTTLRIAFGPCVGRKVRRLRRRDLVGDEASAHIIYAVDGWQFTLPRTESVVQAG